MSGINLLRLFRTYVFNICDVLSISFYILIDVFIVVSCFYPLKDYYECLFTHGSLFFQCFSFYSYCFHICQNSNDFRVYIILLMVTFLLLENMQFQIYFVYIRYLSHWYHSFRVQYNVDFFGKTTCNLAAWSLTFIQLPFIWSLKAVLCTWLLHDQLLHCVGNVYYLL